MKKLLLTLAGCFLVGSTAFAQNVGTNYYYVCNDNNLGIFGFPKNAPTNATENNEGGKVINIYYTYGIGTKYSPCEMATNLNFTTDKWLANNSFVTSIGKPTTTPDKDAATTNSLNIATIVYGESNEISITCNIASDLQLYIDDYLPYMSPVELNIADGVTVFEFDRYESGYLYVKEYSGSTIPANQPVILKAGAPEIYTFTFAGSNTTSITTVTSSSSLGSPSSRAHAVDAPYKNGNTEVDAYLYGVFVPHLAPEDSYFFDSTSKTFVPALTRTATSIPDGVIVIEPFNCYVTLPEADSDLKSISIQFPEGEEQSGFSINLGENDTEQSGTVENNEINITTLYDNAYIFVEVGADVDAIYYYIAEKENEVVEDGPDDLPSASYVNQRRRLPADATYSVAKVKDGIATIHLNVGSGQLYIATSEEGANEQEFTYVIEKGVPTAVEAVEAAADENGAIYNIFGQKVDTSYKGIVIKNGKKFIQR